MAKFISFDMDGTLINSEFTDWIWKHGIPALYAQKYGTSFDAAKTLVEEEYQKVGEDAVQWYDIKYWFRFFRLETHWQVLMERYTDKIDVYPDVNPILEYLRQKFLLILASNAGREFIDIELKATGLERYFDRIFSATSDFGNVKKTTDFYRQICETLGANPHEIIHVGDHYEFDYLVPRKLGIHAFYLDRSGGQKGSDVLGNLQELRRRLPAISD